jgi:hypothetical protein
MKPSIFIMTKYKLINLNEFSNDQIYLDKLDNRFIDREELKLDMITKFGNIKVYGLSQRYIKEIRNLEKEILELLK